MSPGPCRQVNLCSSPVTIYWRKSRGNRGRLQFDARRGMLSRQAIALNRFGLGARPDEAPPPDPKSWLDGQFDRFEVKPAAFAGLPDARAAVVRYTADLRE